MKLTNKCKEDFETYLESSTSITSMYSFRSFPEPCKNALIVYFFDSVVIYVNCFSVALLYTSYGWGIDLDNTIQMDYDEYQTESEENEYESRNEAYIDAFIKANKIYNHLHND